MKTMTTLKKCLLALGVAVLSTASLPASASQRTLSISIEVFPYVASLGSNATAIETQLVEKAVAFCGSLGNVLVVSDVNLEMRVSSSYEPNPNGTPGAPTFDSVLAFSYPLVSGTATVVCKQ